MIQETNPAGEKVYDPLLGEERDAFPGEVVIPEEEKTLNRLMREDRQTFKQQFDPVIATGQLTEEEINAIKKAANIRAEIKRKEYLEAIRQNPANILQAALKEFNPEENPTINYALLSLDQNVAITIRSIESKRSSDQIRGEAKKTIVYAGQAIEQGLDGSLTSFVSFNDRGQQIPINERGQSVVFTLFRDLGFIPSENLKSFNELFIAVRSASNQPSSGMPYLANTSDRVDFLAGLRSKKPGLEGVQAILKYDRINGLAFIDITATTSEVLARIVDKGQYIPYNQQSR